MKALDRPTPQRSDGAISQLRLSRDMTAELERCFSAYQLQTSKEGNAGSANLRIASRPVATTAIKMTEKTRQAAPDERLSHLNLDHSYLALLKAGRLVKGLKSLEKTADEIEGLREALANLAARVEQQEEVSLDLRNQLARANNTCDLWKMRATKAEQQLESLVTAILRWKKLAR